MNRIALPPRIILSLFVILALSACGPTIGNTFSSISNSLPDEEPAATEEPAPEVQPTKLVPDGVLATQPVVTFPTPTALPNTGGGGEPVNSTSQPAIPERRRITLEFPPTIRAGDSDVVRLTLEVDELGNLAPTAEFEGNVVTGEVIEIPNLYESHIVIAEARFDIAGLRIAPPDLVSQPLAQGQSITFHWSILPEGVGIYRGTIWLYLRFVDKVSGEESRRAVSAQPIEIEAVNFLGLSLSFVRSFGVIGSLVGTVIGFPFLEDVVKFLVKRRNKR